MKTVLDVQNLSVDFRQDGEVTHAVRGVSFKVGKGEYRGVLKGLEGLTGLTAVNVDEASRGGTSDP